MVNIRTQFGTGMNGISIRSGFGGTQMTHRLPESDPDWGGDWGEYLWAHRGQRGVFAPLISDDGRQLSVCFDFWNTRNPLRILDRLEVEGLRINADDDARPGDVVVYVELRRLEQGVEVGQAGGHPVLTGTGTAGGGLTGAPAHRTVTSENVTVARLVPAGIQLVLHEDYDVEYYDLESGHREFGWHDVNPDTGADITGQSHTIRNIDTDVHGTARVVLRETAPRIMNLTGNANGQIEFEFHEGIQVLAVRINTDNDGFDGAEQLDDVLIVYTDAVTEGYLGTRIHRNSVTMRPLAVNERNERAEIELRFYLSVQAGFEQLFGEEIEVIASGRALGDYSGELAEVVALVWDPIIVESTPVRIDDVDAATFGRVLRVPISDVYPYETYPSAWRDGTHAVNIFKETG